ncbi:MAG: DUF262 domain-containing protein [Cyanobacteria bacterium MAG CAR3_bin_5]|nr:DUF262 domain-containing protein [Cyanobacteria bacterium MAG CAR3_bin_5]
MQTTSYSLNELLGRARGGTLTIPRFQRKFIWKQSQTTLLIDSMSRSYPIGSLLLLSKNSELQFNARSIEAEIHSSENNSQMNNVDDNEYYILDGQQRLTSIARVFLNADLKRCYYFDLKKMKESHEKGEDSWISCLKRGKYTPDRKDKKGQFLRADIVLEQARADVYVSEYIEDSGDFDRLDRKESREAAAKIKGIFEIIRNYKVPAIIIERSSKIESVCRIFETINSTGTRLKTFDLAVARFYPEPDLRKLWQSTQEKHPILKDFDVDGERILQVLYLVTATCNQDNPKYKYMEPTRSSLMNLKPQSIYEEWDMASESLAEAYGFAKKQGARPETLPRHSLLVSLAAVRSLIFREQRVDPWSENRDIIRRWYFSKVMQSSRAQSSNYQVSQDFKALLKYACTGQPPETPTVDLNPESLLTLKSSDVRYKSLQNIFAISVRQDFWTGDEIKLESQLHDHHIFPKNANKIHNLAKNKLDSICNRMTILSDSNLYLGEAYPKEYFKEMVDRARTAGIPLGDLSRRVNDCLIPGEPEDPQWADSFSINRFEEFCRERANLIISRVRQIVGDSLQGNAASDNELMDDDDY